nr:hypothetical protein [Tanacetum cinerariifolium]
MMKGSDIGIQEKKDKLFNEWERFTSSDGESIESYYHRFLKLMNDFKRNKYFPENISSNLKFLNNLQPEWSRHVTIVHQTKDLHTADYTQLYDFLKYNQKEVNDLRAERLAKTQDPLELMATSNNPYTFPVLHQDQPSPSTYMQQPMPNPKDITDPTTAMNMALALMAKAFKLNYSTPTNNNREFHQTLVIGKFLNRDARNQNGYNVVQNVRNQVVHDAVQNTRVQNVGNQNGLIVVSGIANQNPNGNDNLVATRAEGNATGHNDLDEIEEVNTNFILMANLQQASTSGTQTDKAPVYDSDGSYTYNWSSSAHQELHKIIKDEIFPIINQVDARVQNFEIQFLKEATKFVRDFKSLAKEADKSLAKHKALELEIERLLSTVENEYAKLWNDWYKKCEECKYDKISYDKAYNDMQQKIERLQAQLGDLKGKSKDTSCVSDTLNPLSQKLENENVELEFQDTTSGTSANTKYAKQSILGKPPSSSRTKLYVVTPIPKSTDFPKVGVDNIAKTRRPQPRSNIKNDRGPSASKSSCSKNKGFEAK